MVQRRIESESTKIGDAGFNPPALDFQRMTELQMRVCDIGIELERLSVGVLGLGEIPGLLQSVAVLNPYRGIVRLVDRAPFGNTARPTPSPANLAPGPLGR